MHLVPIQSILISPNRQRRAFDEAALSDLASSIQACGLLHPIVVRKGENGSYGLVAGERRLRAIELLEIQGIGYSYGEANVPPGSIPINFLGDLTPLEAEEAELAENTIRVDLSWQERTEAIVKLARIKEQQSGETLTTRALGASVLPDLHPDVAGQAVRQAFILQAHLDDPEISKAKTQTDALKIIKRRTEERTNALLATRVGSESISDRFRVYNADSTKWITEQPDGQFDCILIDPPYGIGADEFGDAAGKMVGIEHGYADSPAHAIELLDRIIGGLYRVAKPAAHLYIWCDIDLFHNIRTLAQVAGWWTHRTPLVNVKKSGGRVPWPEHGPRRAYELVLYAVKGKRPVTAILPDVFESGFDGEDSGGHGAAKPVGAYVELLRRSCRPGDSVLDCFAGTGTIIPAAHRLSLKATAVELEPAYYGMCLKRLEGLK